MSFPQIVHFTLPPQCFCRLSYTLLVCPVFGDSYKALEAGLLNKEDIFELGNVIIDKELQRTSADQITVADLTGVAIQDAQIAKAVYDALR